MARYIVKRLALLTVTLLGVLTLTFFVSHVVPGDPARLAAGVRARPEQVEALRTRLGLDRPLWQQYGRYIAGVVRGDLGESIRTRRPVSADLAEYFPATVELTVFAMVLCLLIGIPLGIISAVKRESVIDHVSRVAATAAVSMPTFWLGLLLQLLFFRWLQILPATGRLGFYLSPPAHATGLYVVDSLLSGNWTALGDSFVHLILPGAALAASSIAVITRMTRSSLLEILSLDYVRTARSKGLAEKVVILKHALRNALLPSLTVIGLQVGVLLAGAVLIEVVFSWPGIGLYAVQSITFVDFQAILGVTLITAIVYSGVNLIVDVLYGVIDPRIHY
jgi:ABC-type dipeptide/oligopeptide/nickel transport system permease component